MSAIEKTNFIGAAKPLDALDVPLLARSIGCGEDELQAFLDTETNSKGFDAKGRPIILFEPHVFYRNLRGAQRQTAVDAGLAYKSWGEKPYPKDSYPRLHKAIAINPTAALKACSWGRSQVLGENFKAAGFKTVQDMVLAFMRDEEEHIKAMVNFIIEKNIDEDLVKLSKLDRPTTPEDCIPIVEKYNGKGFRKNGYHIKFANYHNMRRKQPDTPIPADVAPTPAPIVNEPLTVTEIRHLQEYLAKKGYPEVGNPDGRYGTKTRGAILAFEADNGLPLTGEATFEILLKIQNATPRAVAPERAAATKEAIADKPIVAATDGLRKLGTGLMAASGVGAVLEGSGDLQKVVESANKLKALTDVVGSLSPWVIGLASGIAAIYVGRRIVARALDAYREGRLL
jgi:peptidoglycan hydrolase-like protein with peptidoglycan-binding domain